MSVASRKREKEAVPKFNKTVPDWVTDQVSRWFKDDIGNFYIDGDIIRPKLKEKHVAKSADDAAQKS